MPPTNLAQNILAPISNVRRPKTSSSNLRHSFRRRKRKPSTSTSLLKSSSHSKLGRFCTDFHANSPKKRARLQNRAIAFNFRRLRVSCEVKDSENRSNGEEPPESLFMKELKRRGMTPASLGEEKNVSTDRDGDVKFWEEDGGWSYSRRNEITIDVGTDLSNQREKSMALNSEGLEGLIPRAKLLLTLGGTFFLAFWPLILVTVASSSALYLYFGPEFVYDGSKTPIRPHQYVDPYALLEEERIYKTAPHLN